MDTSGQKSNLQPPLSATLTPWVDSHQSRWDLEEWLVQHAVWADSLGRSVPRMWSRMLEGHRCQLTHPSWTWNPSPYQEMAGLEEDQGGPSKPGSPGGLSQELGFF